MLPDIIARQHTPGSDLRCQVMHGNNQECARFLREQLDQRFHCTWMPTSVDCAGAGRAYRTRSHRRGLRVSPFLPTSPERDSLRAAPEQTAT